MGGGVESVWLGVSEGQVTQYSRIGKFTYSYVTQNVGYNQKSWTFSFGSLAGSNFSLPEVPFLDKSQKNNSTHTDTCTG